MRPDLDSVRTNFFQMMPVHELADRITGYRSRKIGNDKHSCRKPVLQKYRQRGRVKIQIAIIEGDRNTILVLRPAFNTSDRVAEEQRAIAIFVQKPHLLRKELRIYIGFKIGMPRATLAPNTVVHQNRNSTPTMVPIQEMACRRKQANT